MPKQVIALEATLNSGPAEGSVKSLKAQLREAVAEVQNMSEKFGETSAEAVKAAKRAAELKDKIGEAKALTDAFNPDAKFNAFAKSLQGVAGGFAAVQGAIGLMGVESKDVEQALLKVNSAMALASGLNQVTESIDSFKKLGAVLKENIVIQKIVTAAQWLWNAAMDANPIGAIIIAITALIAGIAALTKYLIDSASANKQMTSAIEKSTKALKEQTKAYEKNSDELQRQQGFTLELAKAKGATTKEIRALEKKLMDEKIAHLENARQIAVNTYETEKNTLAKYKAAGASDEVISKQRELQKAALEEANKVTADLNKSLIERVELNRKHIVQVAQENTNAETKAAEQRKQNSEKAKAQKEKDDEEAKRKEEEKQKAIADIIKKWNDHKIAQDKATDDLILRNRLQNILDTDFKAQQEIEINRQNEIDKQLEAFNQGLLTEEQYNQNKALINANYNQQQLDQTDKINADRKEKNDKAAADDIKTAEETAKAKIKFLGDVGNAMGTLSDVIGKETAVGKSLAVAQATINTWLGATEVLRAKSVLPEPIGTISKIVNVAAIVASGIKSVKSILSTKVPGGSGSGGGGSIPSLATSSISSPIQPQLGQTALNQQLINQTGNASVRAFVLETDVSGNQERIRRLNRAARIN